MIEAPEPPRASREQIHEIEELLEHIRVRPYIVSKDDMEALGPKGMHACLALGLLTLIEILKENELADTGNAS